MKPFSQLSQLASLGLLVLTATAACLEVFEPLLAVTATVIAPDDVASQPEAVRCMQHLAAGFADCVVLRVARAAWRRLPTDAREDFLCLASMSTQARTYATPSA